MTLSLPIEDEANELLSRSPLALLTAMLLDQQVPLEKAFSSPYQLALRLGHEPTAAELADYDPAVLAGIFAERPALHRFPRAMAARVQELARLLADRYGGDAEQVWAGAANGGQLRDRLAEHNIKIDHFDVELMNQSATGSPQNFGNSQGGFQTADYQPRRNGSGAFVAANTIVGAAPSAPSPSGVGQLDVTI